MNVAMNQPAAASGGGRSCYRTALGSRRVLKHVRANENAQIIAPGRLLRESQVCVSKSGRADVIASGVGASSSVRSS